MTDNEFKKAVLDVLEKYGQIEYIYASRCFPSMCSYVIVEDKEYDIILDDDNDLIRFLEEQYAITESITKDIFSKI